jgi:hypothetical protein
MSLPSLIARMIAQPRSWLRAVVRRDKLEAEMDAELACHLEHLAADLIRAGLSKDEAVQPTALRHE